jgi:tRNA A-37 threonylcarbamoyl transferase component Bud32
MTLNEMIHETERLSKLIDAGIAALVQASADMAHSEHALRKATAVAWVEAPNGTVPFKEAWVESATADEKLAFDIAESGRYNALEAVRSRRAQLSAIQSIMAAYRAEAELTR